MVIMIYPIKNADAGRTKTLMYLDKCLKKYKQGSIISNTNKHRKEPMKKPIDTPINTGESMIGNEWSSWLPFIKMKVSAIIKRMMDRCIDIFFTGKLLVII